LAQKVKILYRFVEDGQSVELPVGGTYLNKEGVTVKVRKYECGDLMNRLWVTYDNGNWFALEQGRRTPNGEMRSDFERIKK